MEEDVEVIFESWLYKLAGLDNRRSVRLSSGWKKRYFVLLREGTVPVLQYYERKPRSVSDQPKERFVLHPWFRLERHNGSMRGRDLVCEITLDNKHLFLAAEEDKIFHLFMFFTQTQKRLLESLESSCYVVRPDNSEDHRRLGSRGSMCLFHVSKYGITLAVQLSKCVIGQWPLHCIKTYESTGRGQFLFDAGRRAPSGEGLYVFNTRVGQDNQMYDDIDRHVMELAGLKQMVSARSSKPVPMESVADQASGLLRLTEVYSDVRFIPHLKKISRDIYDHLLQHIGGSMMSRLNASNPDLLSDSPHSISRSASSQRVDLGSPPHMVRHKLTNDPAQSGAIPKHSHGREDSQLSAMSVDSQYLHMSATPETLRTSTGSSHTSEWYTNTQIGTPPIGYDLALGGIAASPSSTKANISMGNNLAPIGENGSAGHDSRSAGLDSRSAGHDSRSAGLDSRSAGNGSRSAGLDSRSAGHDSRSTGLDSRSAGHDSRSAGHDSRSAGHDSRSVGYDIPKQYRGELSPEDKGDGEYVFASDHENVRYVQQRELSPRAQVTTTERTDFRLQRLHSKSAEDLSEYMKMSTEVLAVPHTYDNDTFRMSDEVALSHDQVAQLQPWLYSYAATRPQVHHTRTSHSYDGSDPTAPPVVGRPPQFAIGSSPDQTPEGYSTLPASAIKRSLYSKPNKNFRKSMSNPNLIEADVNPDEQGASPTNDMRSDLAKAYVKTRLAQEALATGKRTIKTGTPLDLNSANEANDNNYGFNLSPESRNPIPASPTKSLGGFSNSTPHRSKSKLDKSTPFSHAVSPTTMKGIQVTSKTKVFTKQVSTVSDDSQGSSISGSSFNDSSLLRRKESSENPMMGRRLPSLPPSQAIPSLSASSNVSSNQRGFKNGPETISETTC